ncbi:MAG: hypothetical protein IJA86_09755 [Clostridia bacterium]|nr:hypothetical protein [Clostridia bacterium]
MSKNELLSNAIDASFRRFSQSEQYRLPYIFNSRTVDSWPGDWVGRTLLAFNHLYELTGKEIPAMHEIVENIDAHINENGHLGAPFDGTLAKETLITGHLWYVRGFLRYAKNFKSEKAMEIARKTVENLYLPLLPMFEAYPLERYQKNDGGIAGKSYDTVNGWELSTDVGCGFMCLDALVDYYEATEDLRVLQLIRRLIEIFDGIDFVACGFQTHCTLSTLRAILRFYELTDEKYYFEMAKAKFEIYLRCGMTLTYENFNWFGKEKSWTEPCAVVDSLMLAKNFYRHTKENKYRILARRIWFNGLQFCQRPDGGCGSNSCVTKENPILSVKSLQNSFCCNMRYTEGLLEVYKDEALFALNENEEETVDVYGRHFMGDRMLVLWNGKKVPLFSCRNFETYDEIKDLQLTVLY